MSDPNGYPQCLPGSDADCLGSLDCINFGNCTLSPDSYLQCQPGSQADCANSSRCTQHGTNCTLSNDAGPCNDSNQITPCCV